jgi:hypothetical protein
MFRCFWFNRPGVFKARPRRARLQVVQLEARDCPSGDPIFGQVDAAALPPIVLGVEVLPGHEVQLSGIVTASNAAGATVSFSGAVNDTTIADADGVFSLTTSDATLGVVQAVASCNGTPITSITLAQLAVADPVIDLTGLTMTAETATFVGNLQDLDFVGQVIGVDGATVAPVATDTQGDFQFTVPRAGLGVVSLSESDLWGNMSQVVDVDFNAMTVNTQVVPGHTVTLSGRVNGAQGPGATIAFSGAVSGSTIADANGNYTFTTSAATLGAVYAIASQQNTPISAASSAVTVNAPTITLGVSSMTDTTVTLTGTLTDVDAGGKTIAITGVDAAPVVTDANGAFKFTVARANVDTIDVSETDLWGLTSNQAEVSVANAVVIDRFSAILQDGTRWELCGKVTGVNVSNYVVSFAGLESLPGTTAVVNSDGDFAIFVTLALGDEGTVSAQITQGATSNIVYAEISY